jgi:hypothetical protein
VRDRAGALLLGLSLALAGSAGVVLALDAQPGAGKQRRAEEFHRLVGGLGFGPALDLERCAYAFDPRLCPACSGDCGPIPGGLYFCPHHAGSPFDYPPPALHSVGAIRPDGVRP